MKQSLVTRKNRKIRKLRERYPDVKIKLFTKRDFERLAHKYGLNLVYGARRGPARSTSPAGDPGRASRELGAEIARRLRRRATSSSSRS